jgi:hypothetical protein
LTLATVAAVAFASGCGSSDKPVEQAVETAAVSVKLTRGGQPFAQSPRNGTKLVLVGEGGVRYELIPVGRGVYQNDPSQPLPVGTYTATLELGANSGFRPGRPSLPLSPDRVEVKPGGKTIPVAVTG